MPEELKPEPYLLDDEEFARVMSYQYKKSGKPRDRLAEQRIWNRLSEKARKKSPRWIYTLSTLAVVAVLLIFVRPQADDIAVNHEPVAKNAVPDSGFNIEFTDQAGLLRLQIRSGEEQVMTVYASDRQNQRQRLLDPLVLQPNESKIITLELDAARQWHRICVLMADDQQELERMEGVLDLVWTQLTDRQCLTR